MGASEFKISLISMLKMIKDDIKVMKKNIF